MGGGQNDNMGPVQQQQWAGGKAESKYICANVYTNRMNGGGGVTNFFLLTFTKKNMSIAVICIKIFAFILNVTFPCQMFLQDCPQ